LPAIIENSINSHKLDKDLKNSGIFHGNLVLTGGSSLFRGLDVRLKNELSKNRSDEGQNSPIKVIPGKKYAAFTGASILNSLSNAEDFYVQKFEYEEYGPSIVHRVCLY